MKTVDPKDLINKYLAGESTLEDEEQLFNSTNKHPGIGKWATYVKQKREKAPAHLNDSIWSAIQNRKRKKKRYLMAFSGVAASIALLMSVFIYSTNNSRMGYDEKEAMLHEALSMFSDEKNTPEPQNILYEDELVIVYLTTE